MCCTVKCDSLKWQSRFLNVLSLADLEIKFAQCLTKRMFFGSVFAFLNNCYLYKFIMELE